MSEAIKRLLRSYRFWTAVGTTVAVAGNELWGLDERQLTGLVAAVLGLLLGPAIDKIAGK